MNKIYKVVWNKAKHCYVVASELAKRHTKGSGTRGLRMAAVTLGITAALTVGMSVSAWADATITTSVAAFGDTKYTVTGGNNVTVQFSSSTASPNLITITATDTTYSAGDGLSLSGTTFSAKPGTNVTVDSNGINVTGTDVIESGGTNLATSGGVYTALTGGNTAFNGASLGVTGDATVGGTLGVTGATTLSNTLAVTGATTTNGITNTGDVKTGTLTTTGNATVGGTLGVTGATTLSNTLDVTGATTLGSTLDVTGATTLKDTLTVEKAATLKDTLDVTGATTLGSTLDVTGATTLKDTLTVEKAATLNDTLTVKGDTELQSNLKVGGEALFNEGKTNQIKIDESGIRIGLHSGQIDDEGFYAGGHTWDEAMAAMGADGRIKGTEFIVNGKTYIDKEGLNANHQKIRNLAPGDITPTSTDAINGTQMYELSQELRKVGAGAAAMANLRPVDMGNRFSVALGVGGYRDEKAMAVGLFYRPTDRIMINMSGTVGNSNNMIGGGISFALDKIVKPVGGADNAEIKVLKAENAEIKAELAELKAAIKAMKAAK